MKPALKPRADAASAEVVDLFAPDLDKEIARLRREVREAERAHRGVGRARRRLSAAIHQRMRRDAGR
jgi:hypothetical protein